ncbi:hypothetical protein HPB49_020117 [Dermacentor silvarum]|uniref:Uncharacterized protein n=1 Tax=Dermacentor silvarum TaxID=543639 RepID=A0ACB8CH47_DERSI|nr:hypothetical protein HPB49_020117 [Dermacentor silvarum]
MGNFVATAAAAATCTASPVTECQEIKQGSLMLRLSFNGQPKAEKGPTANNKPASAPVVPKTAASGEDNADVPKNGTIDDLLLASSIAFDTDSTRVSLEEELGGGRASSSMRDAIQGMPSMSKSVTFGPCDGGGLMGPTAQELLEGGPLNTGLALGLAGPRGRDWLDAHAQAAHSVWLCRLPDVVRRGRECHADDDCLPWTGSLGRRASRKKSVNRTIEDTASKLANKPPPKRSYHRKKAQAPPKAKEKDMGQFEAGPPTSSAASIKPSLPPDAFRLKKPKKGFIIAKQRLGKILKVHKMIY